MSLLTELERVAATVEKRLERLLAKPGGSPEDKRLGEAMRYAALSGGKRLRPFLLVESARLFGVKDEEALPAATAHRLRRPALRECACTQSARCPSRRPSAKPPLHERRA